MDLGIAGKRALCAGSSAGMGRAAAEARRGAVAQPPEERVRQQGHQSPETDHQRQAARGLALGDQRIDLEGQRHQQVRDQDQARAEVRRGVQRHEPPPRLGHRDETVTLVDSHRVQHAAAGSQPSDPDGSGESAVRNPRSPRPSPQDVTTGHPVRP